MKNPRLEAAQHLSKVLQHQGSLAVLQSTTRGKDDALIQELCFGVCRHYDELEPLLSELLEKPLRRKDLDVHCLLLVGLYQLLYLRIPDHAAINETVAASSKRWAKGLINAILRECRRRYPEYEAGQFSEPGRRFSHPAWLVERIQQDWPDEASTIMSANNARPPMTLRVNTQRTSRDDYLQHLQQSGFSAQPGQLSPHCLYLDKACLVAELPGFEDGLVSVQDEASQLCASLWELNPGLRILDACAAPGGKTCCLLEAQPGLECVALDNDMERLRRVDDNLARLGLQAETLCADAGDPGNWWDGRQFDRILLDAPCSATGVIRRHPDIKLLRTPNQLEQLQGKQSGLLAALWPLLKPGGYFLYSTCSILLAENEQVIENFSNTFADVEIISLAVDWGQKLTFGRQLLPGLGNTDGFYYALLKKC